MGFGKKLTRAAVFGALVAGFGAGAQAAELGDTNEPIKLALNEWTGQHITTKVAGTILQRMGYDVEYVTAGYYPQLTAIRDNTISATLEIWSSNIGEHYAEALGSDQAIELGDLGLVPVETWFYNTAAAGACQDLTRDARGDVLAGPFIERQFDGFTRGTEVGSLRPGPETRDHGAKDGGSGQLFTESHWCPPN